MADDKPYKDAEKLRKLYHGKGLTTREIADRCGCHSTTISNWLNKHGIETRENWKAGVKAAKSANRVERVKLRMSPNGYMYWGSTEQHADEDRRTSKMVYTHRLLAVSEYGFEKVADNDVHHRNGVKWDNRPDNIEVLSKSEHARRGNEQRISNTELIEEIHRLNATVDGKPTTYDLKHEGRYSYPTYKERFGGWETALKEAFSEVEEGTLAENADTASAD